MKSRESIPITQVEELYQRLKDLDKEIQQERRLLLLKKWVEDFKKGGSISTIFNSVDYTRADNVFCGMRGESTAQAISDFLIVYANTLEKDSEHRKTVEFLSNLGERLAQFRQSIKEMIMLDQLTNKLVYSRSEDDSFFESSIDEIKERFFDQNIRNRWRAKLTAFLADIVQMNNFYKALQSSGKQILPQTHLSGKMQEVIQGGCLRPEVSRKWANSFEHLETKTRSLLAFFNDNDNDAELTSELSSFMEIVTEAEAVLEYQYYIIGYFLLNKSEKKVEDLKN